MYEKFDYITEFLSEKEKKFHEDVLQTVSEANNLYGDEFWKFLIKRFREYLIETLNYEDKGKISSNKFRFKLIDGGIGELDVFSMEHEIFWEYLYCLFVLNVLIRLSLYELWDLEYLNKDDDKSKILRKIQYLIQEAFYNLLASKKLHFRTLDFFEGYIPVVYNPSLERPNSKNDK